MSPPVEKVAVLGAGALGTAIAFHLARAGFQISGLACRTSSSARAARRRVGAGVPATRFAETARKGTVVFLTVPDDRIEEVCAEVAAAGGFEHRPLVVHCSGGHSRRLLRAAAARGAATAAIHPMQAFPDRRTAVRRLPGVAWGVDADRRAQARARRIVRALRGATVTLSPGKRAFYHLAGVFVSNHVVVQIAWACRLLARTGVPRRQTLSILMPLLEGTVGNLRDLGLPAAITGPASRGDLSTVRKHLSALEREPGMVDLLATYRACGRAAARLGAAKGRIGRRESEALRRLL